MKTYTAMINARVNGTNRTVQTQIRALTVTDAKLLLQAIYGFHSLVSIPSEVRKSQDIEETITPKSPEQQRIENLKAAKKRADAALKGERDRQSRKQAIMTLSSTNISSRIPT